MDDMSGICTGAVRMRKERRGSCTFSTGRRTPCSQYRTCCEYTGCTRSGNTGAGTGADHTGGIPGIQ